jgi:hypothetical protein
MEAMEILGYSMHVRSFFSSCIKKIKNDYNYIV